MRRPVAPAPLARLAATLCALAALSVLASPALGQQAKSYQFKVGVLPFADNTASGNEDIGAIVGRSVQAEFSHSTTLVGRVLKLAEGTSADDIDGEKAVDLGRAGRVDVVLVGTILDASSEESEKGISPRSIFGQSVGASARSVKSVVTLQGDLYNVVDGSKIDSLRVTGRASETKVGADVSTELGSLSSDGSSANSPIGKALNNAVADLVKRVAALQSKMLPNQPGDTQK